MRALSSGSGPRPTPAGLPRATSLLIPTVVAAIGLAPAPVGGQEAGTTGIGNMLAGYGHGQYVREWEAEVSRGEDHSIDRPSFEAVTSSARRSSSGVEARRSVKGEDG